MAGVFDEDIRAAAELIAIYGAACMWQKPALEAGGTPGYPSVGVAPDPIPCSIAFFRGRDVGYGMGEFLAMMTGTEVPVNQEIGLMAGGIAFEPKSEDWIERPDGKVAIAKIDRIAPNGTAVLYFITVAA